MKISVIVPTYKPKEWIWQCLKSLADQTFPKNEFEIVIVLNGCCEPYLSKIKKYVDSSMSENRVNLVQTDVAGVSNARNKGLDIASGEYIVFVDDDDYISPSYLASLYTKRSNMDVVLSDAIAFDDGTNCFDDSYRQHVLYKEYAALPSISLIRSRCFFNGPCMKMIRRSVIGNKRFDVRFSNGEDNLFMFYISNRVKNICFSTSDAVYFRRVRLGSAVNRRRTLGNVIKNNSKIMLQNTSYFLSAPFTYNFPFYISRMLAEIKDMISRCISINRD